MREDEPRPAQKNHSRAKKRTDLPSSPHMTAREEICKRTTARKLHWLDCWWEKEISDCRHRIRVGNAYQTFSQSVVGSK
jgi:hypothetical protein